MSKKWGSPPISIPQKNKETELKMDNVFFESLTPPSSKEKFVYDTLKERILSGQLPPGTSLVQTDLAKKLGVSTIPVRTAVRRLAAEGLLSLKPYRPPEVSELSSEGLEEILLIRTHLEILALEQALPNIDKEDIEDLRKITHQMRDTIDNGKIYQYGLLNKCFHLEIYKHSPCSLLNQMIKDLWNNTDRYRSRSVFILVPDLVEQSYEDHLRMIELLEADDINGVMQLSITHKQRATEKVLEARGDKDTVP